MENNKYGINVLQLVVNVFFDLNFLEFINRREAFLGHFIPFVMHFLSIEKE